MAMSVGPASLCINDVKSYRHLGHIDFSGFGAPSLCCTATILCHNAEDLAKYKVRLILQYEQRHQPAVARSHTSITYRLNPRNMLQSK